MYALTSYPFCARTKPFGDVHFKWLSHTTHVSCRWLINSLNSCHPEVDVLLYSWISWESSFSVISEVTKLRRHLPRTHCFIACVTTVFAMILQVICYVSPFGWFFISFFCPCVSMCGGFINAPTWLVIFRFIQRWRFLEQDLMSDEDQHYCLLSFKKENYLFVLKLVRFQTTGFEEAVRGSGCRFPKKKIVYRANGNILGLMLLRE